MGFSTRKGVVMLQQGQLFKLKTRGTTGKRSGPTAIGSLAATPNASSGGGFQTERKAHEALERALESSRRDNGLGSRLTLSELTAEYLAQHDAEPRTIEKLRWLLEKAVHGLDAACALQPANVRRVGAAWTPQESVVTDSTNGNAS